MLCGADLRVGQPHADLPLLREHSADALRDDSGRAIVNCRRERGRGEERLAAT